MKYKHFTISKKPGGLSALREEGKAVADMSEADMKRFTSINGGKAVVTVPKGYYKLPSVVDNYIVTDINFTYVIDKISDYFSRFDITIKLDITEVDFGNVIDASRRFALYGCMAGKTRDEIELTANWTKFKPVRISEMFIGQNIKKIDFSTADFSKVSSASFMFEESKIEHVRFPNNMKNLLFAHLMFAKCKGITEVDLSNVELGKVEKQQACLQSAVN